MAARNMNDVEAAKFIREQIPANGLFAGLNWRISPEPFLLEKKIAEEIESLGRILFQMDWHWQRTNPAVSLSWR